MAFDTCLQKGRTPPPANLPQPKPVNWGLVAGVFLGVVAIGFILKAKHDIKPKRKGPKYDERKK